MFTNKTVTTLFLSAVIGAGLAAQGMRGGTRIQPDRNARRARPKRGRRAARRRRTRRLASSTTSQATRWSPPNTRCRRRSSLSSTCTATGSAHAGVDEGPRADDGSAQPARADAGRQHQRRSPGADGRGDQRIARTRIVSARLAGIDFRNVGPGWADKAIQQLRADIKAGALGVGELPKQFGLRITKPDGSRLNVDDPEIDPLWDEFAKLDVPVFIHTAEPQEFFQPQDMHNERWLELSLFQDRRNNQPGQVTFEQLMTERNNIIRKHPKTRWVAGAFRVARQRPAAARRSSSTSSRT